MAGAISRKKKRDDNCTETHYEATSFSKVWATEDLQDIVVTETDSKQSLPNFCLFV